MSDQAMVTGRSSRPPVAQPKRLGQILVDEGILTDHRLQEALQEHKATGRRLGEVLMTRGWVSPVQLYEVLATQMGLDSTDLDQAPPQPVYARLIPESVARRLKALPTGDHGHQLVVAMVDPLDVRAIDDLQTITGRSVRPVLANPDQLERAINSVWVEGKNVPEGFDDGLSGFADGESGTADARRGSVATHTDDQSVVDYVEQVIRNGIGHRASDIHLEAEADDLRVRYRVDGVLREVGRAPRDLMAGIVSRLKVMGEMDITNKRSPQDGRITTKATDGHEVSLRVVSMPTVHGESVVLRILDQGKEMPKLKEVGMIPSSLERFESAIRAPSGGVLVTGPTGSGKTTTLYAGLNELNQPGTSIVTVEDPVEYRLAGIKQIQINVKAGMTFASALRAILRADPDIVLVGEIRDVETAKLAAEASLTGHLVLSTLHTNSAAATPVRMIEMGLEPFLVTAGFSCVVAQRLARRLCACKERVEPDLDALRRAGWPETWDPDGGVWCRATGCRTCGGSGYAGRFGIHEVLPISDAVGALILRHAAAGEIQAMAQQEGMLTLRQDGLFKASQGQTTIEEVTRVTIL